jgi:hypothetical protein
MLIANHPGVQKATQGHLDELWKLVDGGEPKSKVIAWLRKGSHKSISDWMANEVAGLLENDKRSASLP